jgi:putative SOS response-associated peptidase YedK
MYGRVRLSNDYSEIKIRLQFDATAPAPNIPPSWNTPPTGPMLVATFTKDGRRVSESMRWGIIPPWAKDAKMGFSTFAARADKVHSKPTFNNAWRKGQRCLVVTNGFYEWRRSGKSKQAYAIGTTDDDLMVMAGLWDECTLRNEAKSGLIQRSARARVWMERSTYHSYARKRRARHTTREASHRNK